MCDLDNNKVIKVDLHPKTFGTNVLETIGTFQIHSYPVRFNTDVSSFKEEGFYNIMETGMKKELYYLHITENQVLIFTSSASLYIALVQTSKEKPTHPYVRACL